MTVNLPTGVAVFPKRDHHTGEPLDDSGDRHFGFGSLMFSCYLKEQISFAFREKLLCV
jgi:hypothetical protein